MCILELCLIFWFIGCLTCWSTVKFACKAKMQMLFSHYLISHTTHTCFRFFISTHSFSLYVLHTHTYVHKCACTNICTPAISHTCVHKCACTNICTPAISHTYVHKCACTNICTPAISHTYVHKCACTNICTPAICHTCVCMCMSVRIMQVSTHFAVTIVPGQFVALQFANLFSLSV